jgi:hypothetical protein
MTWVQIIFFLLAILVIATNIQAVIAYRRINRPDEPRKFPLRKWGILFSSLLAASVIFSTIKAWIT